MLAGNLKTGLLQVVNNTWFCAVVLTSKGLVYVSCLLTIEKRPSYKFDDLLVGSAPMQAVYERIRETAATDVTVLIMGETGTGKDLVAAAIHRHSQCKDGPYLAVNTGDDSAPHVV